jgi:phospholipase C
MDALNGPGACGTANHPPRGGDAARRTNYVDNTVTDQSSILRFVEDNWKTGRISDGAGEYGVAGQSTASRCQPPGRTM